MYQMILVDDEPWALTGLEEILPWNEYGFRICGRCSSAQQALKEINIKKPDAVCVDTRMPKLSGIELISQIREDGNLEVEFVVISAYSDFEVARKAIDYGAVGYVLKPLVVEEVAKTAKRLKERLDQKKRRMLIPVDLKNWNSVKVASTRIMKGMASNQNCWVIVSGQELELPREYQLISLDVAGIGCYVSFCCSQEKLPLSTGWSVPRMEANELGAMIREALASFYGGYIYANHPTVSAIQLYLGENYQQSLSLSDLGARFFLSENYLCELFKKHTGDTILNFLKKVRLQNACRLLKESNLGIKEIAAKVGFSDYSYFGRIFRHSMGQTPDSYRAEKK